jgi:predicted DNA-binding transcriptional regulator AlpA
MSIPATTTAEAPKLLDIDALSKLMRRSSSTIAAEVTKAPHKLPPRLKLPGSRKVLWLASDVETWLHQFRTVK